jgi:hypothetical protein
MTEIALDPRTWDLRLRKNAAGHVDLVAISGAEEVAQKVGIHLRTWLGEWFLDTLYGVPYFEEVLGKGRRLAIVESVLRAQILSVEGVAAISSFSMTLDGPTRQLTVRFEIAASDGTVAGGGTVI